MSSNSDEMKGRTKRAAGDLTGDKSLQREGKADQASGRAKGWVEKVRGRFNRKQRQR